MKKDTLTETKEKENERGEKIKKDLEVHLLELIVMQKIIIFLLR